MNHLLHLAIFILLILINKRKYINSKQRILTILRKQLILKPTGCGGGYKGWGEFDSRINCFVNKKIENLYGSNINSYIDSNINRNGESQTNRKGINNRRGINNRASSSTLGLNLSFIYPKKEKNKYEVKNLENIPLYIVTNEFNQIILSFNFDDSKQEQGTEKKKNLSDKGGEDMTEEMKMSSSSSSSSSVPTSTSTSTSTHTPTAVSSFASSYKEKERENDLDILPEIKENKSLLFPQIMHKKGEKNRQRIHLNSIQNNNSVAIFFFDMKTAQAYKNDILYLYNKNLKEKKNKTFFGSKMERTTLERFLKIQNKHKNKIDFVLIPSYKELQNVLKYKNAFYGTPIYYINKIKLQKSYIKKFYYHLVDTNNNKPKKLPQTKIQIAPGTFLTFSIIVEQENEINKKQTHEQKKNNEKENSHTNYDKEKEQEQKEKKEKTEKNSYLVIQIETDNKKYVPIFFSYEQANDFYNIFFKHLKSNFIEYCLPKPYIVLDSLENILTLLKMANEKKQKFQFFNIFFVPDEQHEEEENEEEEKEEEEKEEEEEEEEKREERRERGEMSLQTKSLKTKGQYNIFHFYVKKFIKKLNYDLFRAFRKNLNYLLTDYYYR